MELMIHSNMSAKVPQVERTQSLRNSDVNNTRRLVLDNHFLNVPPFLHCLSPLVTRNLSHSHRSTSTRLSLSQFFISFSHPPLPPFLCLTDPPHPLHFHFPLIPPPPSDGLTTTIICWT